MRLEEEADGGHSGGSGLEAGGEVFRGDAAEGEDGDGAGELAGFAEQIEAGAGLNELAVDAFFEDGAKQEEVGDVRVWVGRGWAGRQRAADVVEGMAGTADDWVGQAGEPVELADVAGRELAGGAGEVDAGGAGGDGDVWAGVEEEAGGGGGRSEMAGNGVGEVGEVAGGEAGLAEEKKVDAGGGEGAGLGQHGGELGVGKAGLGGRICWGGKRFTVRNKQAVGDAEAQHTPSVAMRGAPRRALG